MGKPVGPLAGFADSARNLRVHPSGSLTRRPGVQGGLRSGVDVCRRVGLNVALGCCAGCLSRIRGVGGRLPIDGWLLCRRSCRRLSCRCQWAAWWGRGLVARLLNSGPPRKPRHDRRSTFASPDCCSKETSLRTQLTIRLAPGSTAMSTRRSSRSSTPRHTDGSNGRASRGTFQEPSKIRETPDGPATPVRRHR